MIKITFLGTSGSIPSKERGMPAISIHAKELFLFDCGEGTQRQMMTYKVPYGSIKAIFLTHPHLDHFLGIYGLMKTYELNLPHRKMPVFAPEGITINNKNVILNRINEGILYENKEFEIHAFKVKHTDNSYGFILKEKDKLKFYKKKAHSLGLKGKMFSEIQEKGFVKVGRKRIKLKEVTWVKKGKKVVYTGDTQPCKGVIKAAKGADLLIHEATLLSDKKQEAEEWKHSSPKDAATIAKKAGVKKLILVHISPRYKDSNELLKEARKIFKNTIIAKDGFILEF